MLNFTTPEIILPKGMQQLANGIDQHTDVLLFKDIKLPELPLREIDTILDLAESGMDAEISVLEWISLLERKDQWDSIHINRGRSSNQLLWKIATKNDGLRYLLYWRMALYLDKQKVSFPKGLISHFKEYEKHLLTVDSHRTKVLSGMIRNNHDHLCRLILKLEALPQNVLQRCGFPYKLTYCSCSLNKLPYFWLKNNHEFSHTRLINIAEKLDLTQRDSFFSSILTNIPVDKLTSLPILLNVIIRQYSPYVKETRFRQLTPDAGSILRELIGVMSFNDFKEIIKKLTSELAARRLGLNERDVKQLNNRLAFWLNYQSRFLGFKVFVPDYTYNLLKQIDIAIDELSLIRLGTSAQYEICVLEFDCYYIVEFLRGNSSGVRVLEKNEENIRIFNNETVLISQHLIESLDYLDEHDHLIYWQNSCEKMLRIKYNIKPNDGLIKFFITDQTWMGRPIYVEYSREIGLSSLSITQLKAREEALSKYHKLPSRKLSNESKDNPFYIVAMDISARLELLIKKYNIWLGYSKVDGWIYMDRNLAINSPGGDRLSFFKLSDGANFDIDRVLWRVPNYLWGPRYIETLTSISSIKAACTELVILLKNINAVWVKYEFFDLITTYRYQRKMGSNDALLFDISKERFFSDNQIMLLAKMFGVSVIDNRMKGGSLKIESKTIDSIFHYVLENAGFKLINNNPIVYLKS